MGEIKTRDKMRDIKVFDRAANASVHMKDALIKSKGAAETASRQAGEMQDTEHTSPADYASERVSGGARKVAERAGHRLQHNPVKKVSENISKVKHNVGEVKRQAQNIRNAVKPQAKDAARDMVVKRTQETARRASANTRQAARNTTKALGKPGNAAKSADTAGKAIRQTARGVDKTVKTASKTIKGTAKAAQKGIKTAERTARVAVKTTQQSAKMAQRAAQAAAKAAKVAVHTAKVAAKAAATAVKIAVKVSVAAIKGIIAAFKALVAAIAAGGWVAVAIILIICLIGLLVGSIFGIFFSGEDSGSGRTMPAVVSELTADFYGQIEDIQRDNPHDVLIMDAMAINWRDVLAVYAVKINTDPDGGMDVATLDDTRVELLRGVLEDMASLSYNINTQTQERIVLDEDGEETTEEVEVVVLTIHMAQKTADETAAHFGFSQTQKDQLHELLDPAYDELWTALIGSVFSPGVGGGEILTGYTGFAPTGIFSWPLAGGYPVNSPFGWRPDPFDPSKTVFHGGADMACPQGTPILAAASGTVIIANATDSWGGTYGYYVKIQHDSTFSTLYAHCSSITVASGQQVQKGQVIGYVGSTGSSSGNHLHFEITVDGTRVDPQGYFA